MKIKLLVVAKRPFRSVMLPKVPIPVKLLVRVNTLEEADDEAQRLPEHE